MADAIARPSPERLVIESLLRIPNKDGLDVDFRLNADQASFDAAKTGRDIIAKYRQGGFSTYPLGCALINCLGYRNRRHVIIAHNSDTTQKLLSRVHYMVKHLKGPAPDLKHSTTNRIAFNKTDSSIFIGTAGSDDYGVGDTITDLHCSEVSRWPHPDSLLTGLFQAVPPSGRILLESTGKGVGNWFHQAVMRAAIGRGYKLHFYNWLSVPEYRVAVDPADEQSILENLDLGLEEDKYAALGLSAGQLLWRRQKLDELGYDLRLFRENYPVTLEECFQATGHSLFPTFNLVRTDQWQSIDHWTRILQPHPKPGRAYCAGIDVSEGTGRDYSVCEILDAETGEQVLEYRNNMIAPEAFAVRVVPLLTMFDCKVVNPERNGPGFSFIRKLLAIGDSGRIHRAKATRNPMGNELREISDYGTYTTQVLKGMMINGLRQSLIHEVVLHSEITSLELGSFVEHDSGELGAESGCCDDTVMALALANHVRPQAARLQLNAKERAEREELRGPRGLFMAGSVMAELEARWRGNDGPISSQVEVS